MHPANSKRVRVPADLPPQPDRERFAVVVFGGSHNADLCRALSLHYGGVEVHGFRAKPDSPALRSMDDVLADLAAVPQALWGLGPGDVVLRAAVAEGRRPQGDLPRAEYGLRFDVDTDVAAG